MKRLVVLFCALFLVAGCAGTNGYLPKHALTNPAEGISIPHPVEVEKSGVKAFTTFTAIMSPDLWTEVVAGGGVYPILGRSKEAKSKEDLFKGYCYVADVNWWGDFFLQCMFAKSKAELSNVKFVVFNRDAGWAYKLDGQETIEEAPIEGKDEKTFLYDASKFEKDEKYQKEFFEKFGMTLKQSDEFFKSYLSEKGIKPPDDLTSVNEIIVGSEGWEEYKAKLTAQMPHNYKMANGQIRSGHLPIEAFKGIAVEDPGFSSPNRFAKRLAIPLVFLPLAGPVGLASYPIMIGASMASAAVGAGVDDSWTGYYARAKIIRYQTAPSFRQITAIYKELLKKRDERTRQLEQELRNR